MADEDAFETSLRATARAWQQGELRRREAVELIARALEIHMTQLAASTPDAAGAETTKGAVYIRPVRETASADERAVEQLFNEARTFWASSRGRRRLGK